MSTENRTQLGIRSALFVPAHSESMIQKGIASDSDVLFLDLEDSVPAAGKVAARERLARLASSSGRHGLIVRVNAHGTGLLVDDVAAVAQLWLTAVLLPKAESRDDVIALDYLLAHHEHALRLPIGSIGIWVIVETARGIANCPEIFAASTRLSGVLVGTAEGGDIYRDLGMRRRSDGSELLYVRLRSLTEARSRGIPNILEGPYVRYRDEVGLRAEASSARDFGFSGKAAIHPAQIGPINEIFGASPEEIDYHRRVLAAMQDAALHGSAATTVDGALVDVAMAERARTELRRAGVEPDDAP